MERTVPPERDLAVASALGALAVVLSFPLTDLGGGAVRSASLATIGVALLVGASLPPTRSALPPVIAPLPLAAALLAVALCVPDTDQIPFAALVVALPLVVELLTRRRSDLVWYAAAAAVIAWAGLAGSAGRASALVGALFAWWAIVIVEVVRRILPGMSAGATSATAALGAVAVVVMARTGGIADSGAVALVVAVVIAGVSLGAALLAGIALDRDGARRDGPAS